MDVKLLGTFKSTLSKTNSQRFHIASVTLSVIQFGYTHPIKRKKMTYKPWLLLTCLACFYNAEVHANSSTTNTQLKQKVSQAITKLEQTKRKSWSYQVSRYENEEGDITSSIEQFMPFDKDKQQWALIRINGESPTNKQSRKFAEKKQAQAEEREKGSNYSVKLREIIQQDSLQLTSESNSHMQMSFNVFLEKLGKDSVGKLQGSLTYNKELAFIENITIVNNDEFSPMFSANITDLTLTLTFININNTVLPHRQDMEMKGTFAYFTEIDEVSTDSYSNYQYKGDQ